MNRVLPNLVVLLVIGLVAVAAQSQDKGAAMKPSTVPDTPEWQKLKSLVGNREGVMEEGRKKMPTTVDVRMTGDGSAIMHTIGRDTPMEMVTMFHPDGKRPLAARQLPRARLPPYSAGTLFNGFEDWLSAVLPRCPADPRRSRRR